MAKNYFIGIGGTGARVLESVLHCCAAGFGPPELTVFLVDPDDGNGNLNRTTALVAEYQRARAAVAERASDDVRLFGTQITAPTPVVWGIFRDRGMSLERYINRANVVESRPEVAQLMEVLFSKAELETPLDQGFRGHPSIGAVVMATRPDVDPWKTFWNDVNTSTGEHSVRVFLVGSIFGGTGAAGVPTFGAENMIKWDERARITRADAPKAESQSKVYLGAALVLPYFSVDLTNMQSDRTDMFVTPDDFPTATKAALQYYDQKDASGNLAFDQIYLLGDSLPQPVGAFAPGDAGQKNRPHYVEVAAALAAFDFFEQDPTATAVKNGPRFFAASRSTSQVDWLALPTSRDTARAPARQAEFKRRVATMTVFGYAFNTLGLATLDRPHKSILDAWYKHHYGTTFFRSLAPERDPRTVRPALQDVATYNTSFLHWIAALDDEDDRVQLVDRTKLFEPRVAGTPPRLLDPEQHTAVIGGLLKREGDADRLGFDAYRGALNELRLDRADMPSASKYVNLFYEAALRFVATNWRLGRPAS